MNFSEQLDKFVERGAEKFKDDIWHHRFPDTKDYSPEGMFNAGSASLKPIVLKLVEYIKTDCCICDQAHNYVCEKCDILNQVSQMLEGGSK